MSGDAPIFVLDGVAASAAGRRILEPLSLALPSGRVCGLIGHNGSGKSTLLKLLARQQAPDSGTIRFAGTPLPAWPGRALARRLAYLPQATGPAAGMLVREVVALGRYPWHGPLGRRGPGDRERIADAMALADVAPFADRLVETLSGGERQRAWLAMLVAQDAGCLLLDEPTSALDLAHQVEVLALVRRLSRERGTSVVVVLHDVNLAARFCDEILALQAGRLVARGTPGDLMTGTALAAIYGIPIGVLPRPGGGAPISYAL
ncbi:Iron(3+)-hydroxamate import ATP-binding protein FhuC [Methylobacterium crusticola]|uniref:Iron(3+)-hydroxamate import ATP-binding protein FhuC n=1 Tax=Methylobacterium crusticola TaxID=1697972 RepID=A0ABQ4R706_9HYPH|nr:ATP-binding cassette domain-containing protein [Methylobacterium crusticola]GJD53458.1 Iron(3+)-hydroxamate import ATP-binding protein FhuC [Methylobacterium crusticola]